MSGATRLAAACPAGAQVVRSSDSPILIAERESRATQGNASARQQLHRPPLPVTSARGEVFAVGGHRGCGENMLPKTGSVPSLRENTIKSFQQAVQRGASFLEFDVQVTRDGIPVIWHDIWIQTADAGGNVQRQLVRDTTLQQFKDLVSSSHHPTQLVRNFKTDNGAFLATHQAWRATNEEALPTLADVFAAIPDHVGFNIEIKTTTPSNWLATPATEVTRLVDAVTASVAALNEGSKRPVAFSSFDPDVCKAVHARQAAIPVLFLSHGGEGFHCDPRRTSVEAAIALALESSLQGLVFDSGALLRHRHAPALARSRGLSVLTYGLANNDPQWVREQQALGVQAAIVDNVAAVVAATKASA